MAAQDGARDSGFRDLLADDDETDPGRPRFAVGHAGLLPARGPVARLHG